MTALYILNESQTPEIPGDVSIFYSLSDLIQSIEAVDVLNNEYYAFSSDGSEIELQSESEYSNVVAIIKDSSLQKRQLATLLTRYLTAMSKDEKFQIDAQKVAECQSLEELVSMIPPQLITRLK